MSRVKTFDSTGLATAGRLYAGDLNGIQDQYADLYNLLQSLGISSLAIGEAGLQLLRYGAGEARLSGAMRTDGILRGLGGLFAGAFTTAQRDAIAAGSRPFTLLIFNITTNQFEYNAGTDASPNWQSVAPALGTGSITSAMIQDSTIVNADIAAAAAIVYSKLSLTNSILNADIAAAAAIVYSKLNLANSIVHGDIAAANKDGAAATPSMRTLGTGAAQAVAGNDARLSDTRTPTDNTVSTAKIQDNAVTEAKIATKFQYGTVTLTTDASQTGSFNFGSAFPTACDAVVLQDADDDHANVHFQVQSKSASSVTFKTPNISGSQGVTFYYIAIGH